MGFGAVREQGRVEERGSVHLLRNRNTALYKRVAAKRAEVEKWRGGES